MALFATKDRLDELRDQGKVSSSLLATRASILGITVLCAAGLVTELLVLTPKLFLSELHAESLHDLLIPLRGAVLGWLGGALGAAFLFNLLQTRFLIKPTLLAFDLRRLVPAPSFLRASFRGLLLMVTMLLAIGSGLLVSYLLTPVSLSQLHDPTLIDRAASGLLRSSLNHLIALGVLIGIGSFILHKVLFMVEAANQPDARRR